MQKLKDVNQVKQALEKDHITYLDERIYEQDFNGIWKNVTPELRHVYEFLESNLLTPEHAEKLEADYGAIPVFESIQKVDGKLKAVVHFDDGQEKWITL